MKDLNKLFNLQLFAGEGGDGGQGGEGDDAGDGKDKTFTQADIDRIINDRLTREREKYKDYDDLKAKATKFDEGQQAQLTEQEKLKKQLEEANTKATNALSTANKRIVTAEMKLQATAQGVPADRVAAVLKLADLSTVKVDDKGDVTGVKESVEACLKANSFLLAGVQGGSNLDGNPLGTGGAQVNPWKKETFNLTKQAQILKEKPALAAQMKAAAGK